MKSTAVIDSKVLESKSLCREYTGPRFVFMTPLQLESDQLRIKSGRTCEIMLTLKILPLSKQAQIA